MEYSLKKIYNIIEPSFRGLAFMLFALVINWNYDKWVTVDAESTLLAKNKMILALFSKIDDWGGKVLLISIFIGIGLLIIINDYLKKIK
jgi:hypothetical protein